MPTPKGMLQPAKESKYYTASDLRRVIGLVGFAVSYAKGVSMRPLIWEDDHYMVVAPLKGKPTKGDILAFEQIRREATAYVMHRLVDIETCGGKDIYVMRGDNCMACERIREEDIIGRVTEVYRNGRWKPWHAIPKKHFSTDDRCFALYSALWMRGWRLRRMFYRMRGAVVKLKLINSQ